MDPSLLNAARLGDERTIEEKLADPETSILHATTPQGNTILHVVARFGHQTLVTKLINRDSSLVLKSNLKGETPVHHAARAGHDDVVRALIRTAKNIGVSGIRDKFGNTPVHSALHYQNFGVAAILADEDLESLVLLNDEGESPLSIAIDRRLTDLAGKIIQLNPCTIKYKGHDDQTALHRAVIRQDAATMNLILKLDRNLVEQQDEKKRTPLHYAAALGDNKMVKSLLETGTSAAYVADDAQQIPLHLAVENGQENLLKALIDPCVDTIEILDRMEKNILHIAAKNGNLNAVTYILQLPEMEDLVNSPDVDGNTPLHLAAGNFHSDVVGVLSQIPTVKISAVNNSNRTALDIVQSSKARGKEFEKYSTLKALKRSYKMRAINFEFNDVKTKEDVKIEEDYSGSRSMAGTISVIATLIATITFTAAFTLPGGLKSDNPDEGTALLITRAAFQAFVISDAIGLTTSITAILIVFWSSSSPDGESLMDTLPFAVGFTSISLVAMMIAFVTGLFVVLRNRLWFAVVVCVIGCAAPFVLYIFAPVFLLVFDRSNKSRLSFGQRRMIIEQNPFFFISRLVKMSL